MSAEEEAPQEAAAAGDEQGTSGEAALEESPAAKQGEAEGDDKAEDGDDAGGKKKGARRKSGGSGGKKRRGTEDQRPGSAGDPQASGEQQAVEGGPGYVQRRASEIDAVEAASKRSSLTERPPSVPGSRPSTGGSGKGKKRKAKSKEAEQGEPAQEQPAQAAASQIDPALGASSGMQASTASHGAAGVSPREAACREAMPTTPLSRDPAAEERIAALEEQLQSMTKQLQKEKQRADEMELARDKARSDLSAAEQSLGKMQEENRRAQAALGAERAERAAQLERERDELLIVLRRGINSKKQLSASTLRMLLTELGVSADDLSTSAELQPSALQQRAERLAVECIGAEGARADSGAVSLVPDAAALTEALLEAQHPDALWSGAGHCRRKGDRHGEERYLTHFLRQAQAANDKEREGKACRYLAQLHLDLKDLDRAEEWYDRLFRVGEQRGDDDAKVRASTALGDIYGLRGRFDKAQYYFGRAHTFVQRRNQGTSVKPAGALTGSPAVALRAG